MDEPRKIPSLIQQPLLLLKEWWVRLCRRSYTPVMKDALHHVHGTEFPPKPDPAFTQGIMADEADLWLTRLIEMMASDRIHHANIGQDMRYPGIHAWTGEKIKERVFIRDPLDDAHLPYLRNALLKRGDFQEFIVQQDGGLRALYRLRAGRYLVGIGEATAIFPINEPNLIIRLTVVPRKVVNIGGQYPSIPPSSSSR